MRAANIARVTATGDVTTASAYLYSVVLSGGSDAAVAVVRAGGAAGTVILHIHAAANTTVPVPLNAAVLCSGGIHVTLTGTSPSLSAVYA